LKNATETEDDGMVDGKGVADKTKFTFSVSVSGEPESVKLFVDEKEISLAHPFDEYFSLPKTFPKGVHTYYFEAKKGSQTTTTEEKTFTTGYSNVAFLPGLEASRLYHQGIMSGDPENQLWEPNRNADVQKLYLDVSTSESILPNIYTNEVIGEINVSSVFQANIYKSFISSMSAITPNIFNEGEALPYDWRYDINDVVNTPIDTKNGSYSMTDEVERLAQNSDTGKVIIIGHSNGGLVGKVLIEKLKNLGKPNVAEKFIMVASPQLGTPQAVTSLLHGQGLPSNMLPFLMSQPTARLLGENMPSGYSLLPSREYFNRVIDPIAAFDSFDPLAQQYFDKYGLVVSNYGEFQNFIAGAEGRTKPVGDDTYTPNILNTRLIQNANQNHDWLDTWVPPEGVEMIQIAGWGVDTIKGIKYVQKPFCVKWVCHDYLDPEPEMTSDGDGTVVSLIATASTMARTFYVNLPEHNIWLIDNRKHEDILEVEGLLLLIKNIISENYSPTENISELKPSEPDATKRLRLKIHSPVSLDLYDTFGNHTGAIESSSGDIKYIQKQIPNSYYLELGEGKYAGIVENGTTTIKLFGQDTGTFTFDIEEVEGDIVIATTTFTDIPVTASTTAIVETQTLSKVPNIMLDINGDGKTDAIISPGTGLSTEELIGIFRGFVQTLDLPKQKETKLLTKIDKMEKAITKEYKNECKKKTKTVKAFANLEAMIAKLQKKNLLTADEMAELTSVLGQIKSSVVK
jgi:pimeloyl-ACP methyl ester carboxylesterase